MQEENKLALEIDKATTAYIKGRYKVKYLEATVDKMDYSFKEIGRGRKEIKSEIPIPKITLESGSENIMIKIRHVNLIHNRTTYEKKEIEPPPIELEEEIRETKNKELNTIQQDEQPHNESVEIRKNAFIILPQNRQQLNDSQRGRKRQKRRSDDTSGI